MNFATGDADFADVGGDGLPDVVHTTDTSRHLFYFNRLNRDGTQAWSLPTESARPSSLRLSNGAVWLADLDGNGLAD